MGRTHFSGLKASGLKVSGLMVSGLKVAEPILNPS